VVLVESMTRYATARPSGDGAAARASRSAGLNGVGVPPSALTRQIRPAPGKVPAFLGIALK
jgi:hypothetical protein